tara:strand:- start:52 stop:255 length:204 start_codon:yes stop_codon:yes gene_type:complete
LKDKEKNRCPAKAKARAVADCRCALRKLDLLDELERLAGADVELSDDDLINAQRFVEDLRKALRLDR